MDELEYQINLRTGAFEKYCCFQDAEKKSSLLHLAEVSNKADFVRLFKYLWITKKGVCLPKCDPKKDFCAPKTPKPGDASNP